MSDFRGNVPVEGVTVRTARPADAAFLAWAVLAATRSHVERGWVDVGMSRTDPDCLEFLKRLAVGAVRSPWHYSGFLIADNGSGPVAALCAARASDIYPKGTVAIREALKECGVGPADRAAFWERTAPWFACGLRPDNDCLAIENVATLPQHRHRGYTAALLKYGFELGRVKGLGQAQVTCLIGNHHAERAYLRSGFHRVAEWRDPRFAAAVGGAGMFKFARAL